MISSTIALIARLPVYAATIMLLMGALAPWTVQAHPLNHPSVHDTMAGVIDRLKSTLSVDELRKLSAEEAIETLTPDERHILGTAYWTFKVNVPVTVSVIRDSRQTESLFWLTDEGWTKTEEVVQADSLDYEVWQKDFDAGHVGLGTNGFRRHWRHYFVAVQPQTLGEEVTVRHLYPGMHRIVPMTRGSSVFVYDPLYALEKVPPSLEGAQLIQAVENRVYETLLVDLFRTTPLPASATPDQILLTWSDDPATTQTIQWRTNTSVRSNVVRYRRKDDHDEITIVPATTRTLVDRGLVNDTTCHRHTVTLKDLSPATTYEYSVNSDEICSRWTPFTTAPDDPQPFKFIYMGDAQNGLETWGKLIHKAHENEPDTAFYIMAGDLVNRGIQRDDWDLFWHSSRGVFDRRQLAPAIGNHEDQGANGPWMYLDMFTLPQNGSDAIEKERSYHFTYGNALFIVLDTNTDIEAQTPWLEHVLANSQATWKFVVYHHPAYASRPQTDNSLVRKWWTPLFDKHHVDMALQGHDHAYLRTYPINNNQRVESAQDGTVYVVSVSGTKFYDQEDPWYEEFGMTKVSTYQVLDLTIEGASMTYKAYDIDGQVRDEFVIRTGKHGKEADQPE